jgi:hypothetical protein
MKRNEALQDTLDTLKAEGIRPEVQQSKHIKVTWRDSAGIGYLLVISRSPSARRTRVKTRSTLRRLIRGAS